LVPRPRPGHPAPRRSGCAKSRKQHIHASPGTRTVPIGGGVAAYVETRSPGIPFVKAWPPPTCAPVAWFELTASPLPSEVQPQYLLPEPARRSQPCTHRPARLPLEPKRKPPTKTAFIEKSPAAKLPIRVAKAPRTSPNSARQMDNAPREGARLSPDAKGVRRVPRSAPRSATPLLRSIRRRI